MVLMLVVMVLVMRVIMLSRPAWHAVAAHEDRRVGGRQSAGVAAEAVRFGYGRTKTVIAVIAQIATVE